MPTFEEILRLPMGRPSKITPEIITALIRGERVCDVSRKFKLNRNTISRAKQRILHGELGQPNPLCACGCGNEVSRPWNKYVLGHSNSKKLDAEGVIIGKLLLKRGISFAVVGKILGISSTAAGQLKTRLPYGSVSPKARKVIRAHELRKKYSEAKEVADLRKGKRLMREIRALLKDPMKLTEKQNARMP